MPCNRSCPIRPENAQKHRKNTSQRPLYLRRCRQGSANSCAHPCSPCAGPERNLHSALDYHGHNRRAAGPFHTYSCTARMMFGPQSPESDQARTAHTPFAPPMLGTCLQCSLHRHQRHPQPCSAPRGMRRTCPCYFHHNFDDACPQHSGSCRYCSCLRPS